MKIGFVGLGRMGLNMVQRLLNDGHEIVAYARKESSREPAKKMGAETVASLEALVDKLEAPRKIWVMVPEGEATEETIRELWNLLDKGDIVVDGGNSNYKDSIRRAKTYIPKGLGFIDCGTSGGIWGLKIGYCLMYGGEKEFVAQLEPVFKSLAPKDGYLHVGPSGSGHFVKMMHNGIEYAILQAYAEGFEILNAKKEFNIDLPSVAHLWNQGSVVRSWLLELAEDALKKDPKLENIKGYVDDSGEGRWSAKEAIDIDVPAPTITLALFERFRSRQEQSFGNKFIAALRNEFGGHEVKKSGRI
ncbi:MAG: decarboxylating 6-phosphogluconate dehydrogenase [Candidatus Omnitrophica bacterium]|nr:decarboxylating 6-phosphogluconate dehydrogenase [Candidatus Omnitrophota bacterium]